MRDEWRDRAEVALRRSIDHWKRLSAGKPKMLPAREYRIDRVRVSEGLEDETGKSCDCCLEFWSASAWEPKDMDDNCSECPIMRYTGKHNCGGTPYARAAVEYAERGAAETRGPVQVEFLEFVLKSLMAGELSSDRRILPGDTEEVGTCR